MSLSLSLYKFLVSCSEKFIVINICKYLVRIEIYLRKRIVYKKNIYCMSVQ